MPVLFTDLMRDEAFEIRNRKGLRELYEHVKDAVKTKKLSLEGHTLPTGFNSWLAELEPDKKPPARDSDVVDFSLADDKALAAWRKAYLSEKNPVYMSSSAKDLLQAVQELDSASNASMSLMNGPKDDVVAALSDLQAAVYMFMTSYDKVQKSLGLPDRKVALERVKIAKSKKTAAKQASRVAKLATDKAVTKTKTAKRRAKPENQTLAQVSQ